MIHKAIEVGSFFNDMNAALIAVLPKPNKDATKCGNYRPLSILNAEIKIFARILTSRIEPHIATLINSDQTGFVKSRLASDNVRRLLHVIHAARDIPSPCAILSLDAEKAFDRLEWEYLWVVLQRFKLGSTFIKLTKLLYNNPSAMINTNGIISNKFNLSRSCRQGCPLSPFLFILSLEPLVQKIRQHPNISPITFNNTTHFISLYADDILLYFDRATSSLPHILDTFHKFSSLSGYKINWTKSALLPLNSKLNLSSLPQHIPVVKQFKYLGVDIFPSLTTIANKNFQGIYNKIEADLNRWSHLPKSVQARVSIIKMDILPRINFFSSMLPLPPPIDYWKKVHSLVSRFIWGGKRPRVKLTTLQRDKTEGGLSVPNFKYYFWSFVLRPLTDWLNPNSDPCWKPIEKNLASSHRLEDLIYSTVPLKRAKLRLGPIMSFLLSTWIIAEKESKSTCKWHRNSPLFHNYSLLTGGVPFSSPDWSSRGIHVLADVYNENGLRDFNDLRLSYQLPGSSLFLYFQLRSSMKAYGVPWNSPPTAHPLHSILYNKGRKRGLVSRIYSLIRDASYKILPIVHVWSNEMKHYIGGDSLNWEKIWSSIVFASKNPNHQQIHFNYIHRTYLTPRRNFFMKRLSSPNCTLCSDGLAGSYLHMYWECKDVKLFWGEVCSTLSNVLEVTVPCSPIVLLLNDTTSLKLACWKRRILLTGITAAKKMLALRWKPPHTVTKPHWINTYIDIINMELSVARIHSDGADTILAWQTMADKIQELL